MENVHKTFVHAFGFECFNEHCEKRILRNLYMRPGGSGKGPTWPCLSMQGKEVMPVDQRKGYKIYWAKI